jgi:hypothetical protein
MQLKYYKVAIKNAPYVFLNKKRAYICNRNRFYIQQRGDI